MVAKHTEAPRLTPRVVSREQWLAEREELLAKEKAFTRQRYALAAQLRELPMVPVDKPYVFDGPRGAVSLADLFCGQRQLIVYHFMFPPTHARGCKHCACVMDNLSGALVHLPARHTSFAAVSRAPIEKIERFRDRMGWDFTWVSSRNNDFNYDFHVTLDEEHAFYNFRPTTICGEMPGLSVFYRDDDRILHSYSTYFVGLDIFLPMYHLLDVTPLGRHETDENSMTAGEPSWIRLHDEYTRTSTEPSCCGGARRGT